MIYCKKCGSFVEDGKYCPECAAPLHGEEKSTGTHQKQSGESRPKSTPKYSSQQAGQSGDDSKRYAGSPGGNKMSPQDSQNVQSGGSSSRDRQKIQLVRTLTGISLVLALTVFLQRLIFLFSFVPELGLQQLFYFGVENLYMLFCLFLGLILNVFAFSIKRVGASVATAVAYFLANALAAGFTLLPLSALLNIVAMFIKRKLRSEEA